MARFNIELSVTGAANTNKALSSVNREATSLEKGYQRLQSTIRDLSAQQGNLQTSMQRLNSAFKSGSISEAQFTKQSDKLSLELSDVAGKIQQAQSRLTSYNATIKQAENASRSFGTANKQLQGYANDFTSGIRSSNAVAVEFSRIIQDAPYGMQGVANNLQQLTQNYAHYTRSVREAAAAQGRTVSTGALVRGALGSLLSPINLLTLGISAVTAGWVAYERWQQRAAKASRETIDEIQELIQGLNNLSTALYEGAKSSGAEIAELQVLYTTIRDGKQAYDTRINAVKQIQEQYPAYFKNLSQEQILTGQAAAAYRELRKDILSAAQAQAAYGRIGEKSAQQLAIDEANKAIREQITLLDARIKRQQDLNDLPGRAVGGLSEAGEAGAVSRENRLYSERNKLNQEQTENLLERAKLQEDINDLINLGVSLQGDQVKEIEKAGAASQKVADIISKLNDSLRAQQEESILSTLTGLDKTIQSIRFQYDALERAADEYRQQTEDAFKQGNISAQQYQANLAAIEDYLVRIGRFEVGAVGRAIRPTISPVDTLRSQSPADRLNRGPSSLPSVNLQTQQPVIAPDFDLSLITQGLKRASRQFINNMSSSLEWLHQTETKRVGDYLLGIGQSIFSSFDSIINNTLANQLEDMIENVFKSIGKGGESVDWSKVGVAGLGIGGQLVSGLTKKTSVGGQALGGALSGAAVGTSILPGWGTAIGAVVGAIGGWLKGASAKRQEELTAKQLEEQKKQTALMERQAALAFTSQIIGQMTSQGLVQGVSRNEFGDIVFRIQGRDLVGVLNKEETANMRGV